MASTLFPTAAQALQTAVDVYNNDEVQQYTVRLADYKLYVAGWITSATRSREIGLPIPPVPTIPTKAIYSVSGTNIATTQWQDPTLQTPTLPPPPPAVPGNGSGIGIGTGPAAQAANAVVDAKQQQRDMIAIQTYAKVAAMESDIAAIKAHLGV